MGKTSKLGRNPLERTDSRPMPPSAPYEIVRTKSSGKQTAANKIREMRIEVDWEELYRSTLGRRLGQWTRFFSRD